MKTTLIIEDATPEELVAILKANSNTKVIKPNMVLSPDKSRGKWKIPFGSQKSFHGKKKANSDYYTKALSICKKWNLAYPDAIKMERGKEPVVLPNNVKGPHWKEVIKKSINPVHEPISSGSDE